MGALSAILEPAFWILRLLYVPVLYFYLLNKSGMLQRVPVAPWLVVAACGAFWLVSGLFLRGARQGENPGRIFAVCLLDLAPAVFLMVLVPDSGAAIFFLIPFLDAAQGDVSLFGLAGLVATGELLLLSVQRKGGFPGLYFSANVAVLAVSALLGSYVYRFCRETRRSETLLSLIEVGQSLGATLSMDKVTASLENVISTLYHYNGFVLYLIDDVDRMARIRFHRSPFPTAFTDFSLDQASRLTQVLQDRQGLVVPHLRDLQDPLIPRLHAFRSAALLPLQFEGTPLGLFVLTSSIPGYFDEEDLRVLGIISNQAAIAIKNVRLHERTTFLAVTDSLTGLYAHGYFQTVIGDIVANQSRIQKPVSILMMDVDWFKRVNDTFGHPQGDRVLAQLARVMKNMLTSRDLLARYGGDEFVALVMDSNKMSAAALAERIRKIVEDVPFLVTGKQDGIRLSISIGVASFPEDGNTGGVLVEQADKALYLAKQGGRNRIAYAGQGVA